MSMHRSRRLPRALISWEHDADPYTQLWTLRAFALRTRDRVDVWAVLGAEPDMLEAIGVEPPYDREPEETDVELARAKTLAQIKAIEARTHHYDDTLAQNVERFAKILALNTAETRVLHFALRLQFSQSLAESVENRCARTQHELLHALAVIVDLSLPEIQSATSRHGVLAKMGLVKINNQRAFSVALEVMVQLEEIFQEPCESAEELLGKFFRFTPRPLCSLQDFSYLERDLTLLRGVLQGALAEGDAGMHVLLHGPPGTGKTELARVLAAAFATTSVDIATEDREGEALSGPRRCAAYRMAQAHFQSHARPLLIFDEIEDLFPSSPLFFRRQSTSEGRLEKGWFNKLLEESRVTTIWIGNQVDHIDPAILRRFHLIMELRPPPLHVRRRMIRTSLGTHPLEDAIAEAVSQHDQVTAADVKALGRVAELLAPSEDHQACVARAWSQRARLFHDTPYASPRGQGPTWQAAYVQSDPPVEDLLSGLARSQRGRLLLYGPPGTGKSALAEELARRCGRPLRTAQASSLLSKWVGESEKSMARLFEEATRDDAIILIDEADSFLLDRQQARASWEITQVNEMLTQMERFPGLFLCSTNLIDHIDEAAFRRFDLKVRFSALSKTQRQRLVAEACPSSAWHDAHAQRAGALAGLTPGDVAMVCRRFAVLDVAPEPDALLSALEDELRLKSRRPQGVLGFAAR